MPTLFAMLPDLSLSELSEKLTRRSSRFAAAVLVAAVAAGAATSTGCRMGDPGYDYCSPIMTGQQMASDPYCDPLFRLGSVYYRNGAYASGRVEHKVATYDATSFDADTLRDDSGTSRAAPRSVPTPSRPEPRPTPAGSGTGGGMRFKTPTPPVAPTPVPFSTPTNAPPLPLGTPAEMETPNLSVPLIPPSHRGVSVPADAGITLESLRQLDPSITDVEIVDVREGGVR